MLLSNSANIYLIWRAQQSLQLKYVHVPLWPYMCVYLQCNSSVPDTLGNPIAKSFGYVALFQRVKSHSLLSHIWDIRRCIYTYIMASYTFLSCCKKALTCGVYSTLIVSWPYLSYIYSTLQELIYTYELCDILFSLGPFPKAATLVETTLKQDMSDGRSILDLCTYVTPGLAIFIEHLLVVSCMQTPHEIAEGAGDHTIRNLFLSSEILSL